MYLTSVFIQIFSTVRIFSRTKQPYSLNKAFYLFCLFFFGVAPILQFYSGASFFGARLLNEKDYFSTNLLIIAIMIAYEIFYMSFLRKSLSQKAIKSVDRYEIGELTSSQSFILVIISLISFSLVLYANNGSLLSMLIRGGDYKEENASSSSVLSLIIYQFCRPLSIICLFYYITSKSKNYLTIILLSILALATCSPLGMPRFAAAALYIPLLLLTIRAFSVRSNIFSLTFIMGLLVIFPFLNSFRFYSKYSSAKLGLDTEMFTTGNFDSYQNFALIVSQNLITWGRQLLGVFLFWVPRSLWPDKPVGSGVLLAEKNHFEFDNVSANYFAEGYINFGIPGIIIFTIILAYFTSRIDKLYWSNISNRKHNFSRVSYFVLIGMLFFILRGDLLSSFAYTISFILAIFAVFKAASFRRKRYKFRGPIIRQT
ncbi:O-antigen polysaccharide polymerase Wzy [Niabella agricola]|uniref:O-antigen polysaccharide polymerase Wzy n=1 Tax=Niabella agricola TaxID=2891571 RepID=UPI00387343D4